MKPLPKVWSWALVALATGGILLATLHGGGHYTSNAWNWSWYEGDEALGELLQNLILFVPLGIGLVLAGVSLVPAIVIGALLSFGVEFAQQWIPGRDPSVADIACNTISAAIGAGLVRLAPRWLTVSPERSGWHALGAAILAVLVWLGTAAALQPTFGPSPYRVIKTPSFRNWVDYRGDVQEARMDGGKMYVKATFPSSPPHRLSALAAVLNAHDEWGTTLAIAEHDLLMRYDTPARKLTLAQPDLRWEHVLDKIAPGETFIAMTGHEAGRLCLALNTEWRCDIGYTIGDGWKLIFYPEHWPGWLLAIINACWVAGWTIGVGFLAGRTGGGDGPRRAAKVAVAIVLLAMIVIPMTTHLKGSSLLEWIGALVGIELGLVLANRFSARTDAAPQSHSG